KILMEENWTDYLLYSSILKVIAVFLIFLNIIFWWVQSFRVNRKHNKKMRIKADPVKIMEEIKQNHEKIIWQGVPENGFCMNFKMIFLIIWSIFWFHGAVVMLVELPSILKVAAVLMSLIGCQPWTMIYREWADNKATRYYITDSRIIKCVTGKDFQQLFYREFHHAKILSLQRDRWVWACKNSIVFAKHPSGYKVFTYGESGDIHDLTIDYISDEEYLVEIINQQREEICKNDWRK
ncbi:MAG: hypothetical protein Q4E73_07255, partial [Lachnospiraceae bacterium]|nr:hypothetical protein [Lachnospiraceae bacterium]